MSADRKLFPLQYAKITDIAAYRQGLAKLDEALAILPPCSYRVSLLQTTEWMRKELRNYDAKFLNGFESELLRFLDDRDSAGYFTADYLSREIGLDQTCDRALEAMEAKGWLERYERENRPVAFCLNKLGRAAARSLPEPTSPAPHRGRASNPGPAGEGESHG